MPQAKRTKRLSQSFKYAFHGIAYVLMSQRNMKIHFAMASLILILALVLDVPLSQFLWVIFSIFFVLCMETLNTAIERTVDLVTTEYHPLAKLAKDVAAGVVLFAALFAVVTGLIVFTEPLLSVAGVQLPFPIEHMTIVAILCFLIAVFLFSLRKAGKKDG
ncbi:diacylglycerol kinase [Caldalkalibacillus uzonensis]|uniref:Diacylglycerol kinase n=1 Tax=Caldalkalibacillus uzonensis TaxID=353224 RepID=A0ABU0CU51_9BACI|nr:diacylglycerol kinase family protein [Caldalkalibacillus uzonensis]MDQ0339642.1 diacylglycerol kinase [Caldalkalibacillus uzonensis]